MTTIGQGARRGSDSFGEIRIVAASRRRLAGTQRNLADEIVIDRSALSIGESHGELGARPFANILGHPTILTLLYDSNSMLLREMGRSAFIAAALLAEKTITPSTNTLPVLDRVDYELLCALITSRPGCDPHDLIAPLTMNAIISSLTDNAVSSIVSDWYPRFYQKEVATLLQQLRDPAFATAYIGELQSRWIDIFVYVWATTEGLGCRDLWQAD